MYGVHDAEVVRNERCCFACVHVLGVLQLRRSKDIHDDFAGRNDVLTVHAHHRHADWRRALTMMEGCSGSGGLEVSIAPRLQGEHHRHELGTAVGEHVVKAWGSLLVENSVEDAVSDKALESIR